MKLFYFAYVLLAERAPHGYPLAVGIGTGAARSVKRAVEAARTGAESRLSADIRRLGPESQTLVPILDVTEVKDSEGHWLIGGPGPQRRKNLRIRRLTK